MRELDNHADRGRTAHACVRSVNIASSSNALCSILINLSLNLSEFFFFASCFLHCRAHPQLVKLMEANGHITDEAMWDVLTELGMEMQAYSLRVQHDKVTSTTHISRRRAVILSNPGFLAQLQQQRAAKEGAIAVLLMPRRRRRFPSSRDLRSR